MRYVLGFGEIDHSQQPVVGGKGANLAELSRIDGVQVPDGFCVTTEAFGRIMAAASIDDRLDRLAGLKPDDRETIGVLSAEIRGVLETTAVPADLADEINARVGDVAYAVRSSATAEDLPTASFAGQQDSYLNIQGPTAILRHIQQCWASLFTERAVIYRLRNGFDHRKVHMAVVVQQMVFPQAAGVLFTADPVTSNRKVTSIEAVAGLGEDLVSGLLNADVYSVRDGEFTAKTQQEPAVLTDAQVIRLAELGRRIEAHFGLPQDIEWCLVDDEFHIVQSRPITTLFPVPETTDDNNHVYVSVGHQQMMTDPMKPLGLAVWQLTTPRPMAEAGGRLFVDVAPMLASPKGRASLFGTLGKSDPLIADALQTIIDREFITAIPDDGSGGPPAGGAPAPVETDPAIVTELIENSQASIAALDRDIRTQSGPALFDFIRADLKERRLAVFDPRSLQVVMAGMEASWWLNDHLAEWLGEKNAADTLAQSVPHNVTSEMGLALLDLADAIRPYPDVIEFLQRVDDEGCAGDFLEDLATYKGGTEVRDAIDAYLDVYGMRCTGEIDITRPRWSEDPTALVPTILSNIRNFEPGAAKRRFEQGQQEAQKKETELLSRLRALPDGADKADEVKRMIDRVRTFAGYREYPKYGLVCRYFIYKQALLREAEHLVQNGILPEKDDIFYLRFEELQEVVRTNRVDGDLIRQRKEAFASYLGLTPPRVSTSDGEVITGTYRRDNLPPGALVGLPVSAGTVDGRARVISDIAQADLEAGDILVTAYTDPSWTPLFVGIAGLITEVGGLMTHGAVIAREYGLPAIVGVEHATRLIQDGQRIRVHGTEGYVEILS
jgi:rifampicin phosphotransferase